MKYWTQDYQTKTLQSDWEASNRRKSSMMGWSLIMWVCSSVNHRSWVRKPGQRAQSRQLISIVKCLKAERILSRVIQTIGQLTTRCLIRWKAGPQTSHQLQSSRQLKTSNWYSKERQDLLLTSMRLIVGLGFLLLNRGVKWQIIRQWWRDRWPMRKVWPNSRQDHLYIKAAIKCILYIWTQLQSHKRI